MNEYEFSNVENENLRNAIIKFASFQPFVGLCSSVISALIQIFLKKQWSIGLFVYVLIPFIGFCIIYTVIAVYMKSKHNTLIPFFNKKVRLISILAFALFIVINILIWHVNKPNEVQSININNLNSISNIFSTQDKYFVIFTSQNCIYCHQMKPVYMKAYAEYSDIKLFICDVSFESTSNPSLTNRNITKLPLLACYQQGKEVDRLEGVVSFEGISNFFKK